MKITLVKSTDARNARRGNIKEDTSISTQRDWSGYLHDTKSDKLSTKEMLLFLERKALQQSDIYAKYCKAIRAGRDNTKAKVILATIETEYIHIQSVYAFWGQLHWTDSGITSFQCWLQANPHKLNQLTPEHISFDKHNKAKVQITLPDDYLPTKNIEKLKQALAKALNKELQYQKPKRARLNDQANLYRIEKALDIYYLKKYYKLNGHQCAEAIKVSNKECWKEFFERNFKSNIIVNSDITPLLTDLTTDAEQIIKSSLNGTFPHLQSSRAHSKYY